MRPKSSPLVLPMTDEKNAGTWKVSFVSEWPASTLMTPGIGAKQAHFL